MKDTEFTDFICNLIFLAGLLISPLLISIRLALRIGDGSLPEWFWIVLAFLLLFYICRPFVSYSFLC